jgi:hypothetical protein
MRKNGLLTRLQRSGGNAARPKVQHNRPVPGAKISGRFASTIGRRFPAERPTTTQGKTDAET